VNTYEHSTVTIFTRVDTAVATVSRLHAAQHRLQLGYVNSTEGRAPIFGPIRYTNPSNVTARNKLWQKLVKFC